MKRALIIGLFAGVAGELPAQRPRLALDTTAAESVRVWTDVGYARPNADSARFDVYLPPLARGRRAVIVVGMNQRASAQLQAWARLLAAHGFAAVIFDMPGQLSADFDALIASIQRGAGGPELDGDNVGWWLASGMVYMGLPIAMEPGREHLRAVAAYYGAPPRVDFRLDRPALIVRVGMDQVSLNRSIDSMVFRALAANAPVTVINHPAGYHPFEVTDSSGHARYVLRQTIAFFQAALRPEYQADARAMAANEGAVGQAMYAGDGARAAGILERLVVADTGNAELVRQLAMAQLTAGRYRAANASFNRARALRHWRRGDIAVGGISACWRMNDRQCVRDWLATLPRQWNRRDLLGRLEFADLRNDAAFVEALTGP